jgi:hypothetical protein
VNIITVVLYDRKYFALSYDTVQYSAYEWQKFNTEWSMCCMYSTRIDNEVQNFVVLRLLRTWSKKRQEDHSALKPPGCSYMCLDCARYSYSLMSHIFHLQSGRLWWWNKEQNIRQFQSQYPWTTSFVQFLHNFNSVFKAKNIRLIMLL